MAIPSVSAKCLLVALLQVLVGLTSLYSQNDTILVVDHNNIAEAGASIQVFYRGSTNPAKYLVTGDNGAACCVLTSSLDSLIITVFASEPIVVQPGELKRRPGTVIAEIITVSTRLPEATVTASRLSGIVVRGDTIEFNADFFSDGREHTLRDLIEKMPGLEVSDDGIATYQGRPVDRVLIDGQDIVRNQFDVLNNLLLPADLLNAQVVIQKDADNRKIVTLNLSSKSKATLRLGADVAATLRAEPVAEANMLRINPDHWQYFARASYAANVEPPGGGLSAIREFDFEIERIRSRVSLSNAPNADALAFTDTDFTSRQVADVEFNIVRNTNGQSTKAYLSANRDDRTTSSLEHMVLSLDAGPLGSNTQMGKQQRARLFASASHTGSVGERLKFNAFGSIDASKPRSTQSGLSTVGGTPGQFMFLQNSTRSQKQGIVNAVVRITDSIKVEATSQIKVHNTDDFFDLSDSEPIYSDSPMTMPDLDIRHIATYRQLLTMQHDLRVRVYASSFTWTPFLQFERQTSHEQQSDLPNQTYTSSGALNQLNNSLAGALTTRYTQGIFNAQSKIGVKHLEAYAQSGLGQSLWAPLATVDLDWTLPGAINISLSGEYQYSSFDSENYWQTVTPKSTRHLLGGFHEQIRFSRQASAIATIKQINLGKASFLLATISGIIHQYSVQTQLASRAGFLFEKSVLAENMKSMNNLLILQRKITRAQRLSLQMTQLVGRFEIRDEEDVMHEIASNRTFASLNLRSEWCTAIFTRVGIEWSRLNQQSGTAPTLPSLKVWRPSMSITFRGTKLTIEPKYTLQLNPGKARLSILDVDIRYRLPVSGLELKLSGNDLTNYNNSTFETVVTSPTQVTMFQYARQPGYLTIGLDYKFAR